MKELDANSKEEVESNADTELKLMLKAENIVNQLKHVSCELTSLYADKDDLTKSSCFLSCHPMDGYLQEEELFTGALTGYTRKQFFEGISELAGAHESLRYDLLETTHPESLLISGQPESVTQSECEELKRLQSIYPQSVLQELDSKVAVAGLQAAVKTARRQLSDMSKPDWLEKQKKQEQADKALEENTRMELLQQSIEQTRGEIDDLCLNEISSLVKELQKSSVSPILTGNYDVKIARQDYFISKQDELIKQLLLQNSRHRFLTLLCEVDLNNQQNMYHVLSSIKTLLENEVKETEMRIGYLENPMVQHDSTTRETIDSQDSFALALYDVFIDPSTEQSKKTLYKTFDSLTNAVKEDIKQERKQKQEIDERQNAILDSVNSLEKQVELCEQGLMGDRNSGNSNYEELIEKIIHNLSAAENEINTVVKDVLAKKKLIESDPFANMEQTLFVNYFTDPARLKRNILELRERVAALS